MTTFPEPGIYHDMPDEEYFSVPALSFSGIKNLLVSPMDFWARSWMNKLRDDVESDSQKIGKAYHKRIVEGKDRFYAQYKSAASRDDFSGSLVTVDDLKVWLKDRMLSPVGKKAELIERCLNNGAPRSEIWDCVAADRKDGKIELPRSVFDRIEFSAAMIEKHPQLSKCFSGGEPEVSVFWIDKETGVPMKARVDYLKKSAMIDLKSFSNPRSMPIDRAIYSNFASYKYHIQAAMYLRAVKQFDPGPKKFVFVFQQTGPAPLARAKILDEGILLGLGEYAIDQCALKYKKLAEAWGDDPWLFDSDEAAECEIQQIIESEVPGYCTDI